MVDLGVKLDRVNPALGVFHSRDGAYRGVGRDFKAGERLGNVVGVAHPCRAAFGKPLKEQRIFALEVGQGLAVFARRSSRNLAAEGGR